MNTFRALALVVAVAAACNAWSQDQVPKLRILSNRTSSVETAGASTQVEQAGADQKPIAESKQRDASKTPATLPNGPARAAATGVSQTPKAAASRPLGANPPAPSTSLAQANTAALSSKGPVVDPMEAAKAERRRNELQKTSERNAAFHRAQVREFPGVPQKIDKQYFPAIGAPKPVAASAAVAKKDPEPTNQPPTKQQLSPVAGIGFVDNNPTSSEIARDGEFYYFRGMLNNIHVRFKINYKSLGLNVPSNIATQAAILPLEISRTMEQRQEVMAPVNSISFGSYPVRAVMAKIYYSTTGDVIDVGPDVLSNFKITDLNGRRMLVAKT
jgi:hypothetical protein